MFTTAIPIQICPNYENCIMKFLSQFSTIFRLFLCNNILKVNKVSDVIDLRIYQAEIGKLN